MTRFGTLIYDAECQFCLDWVSRFERWDHAGVVTTLPLHHPAATLLGASRPALEEAMHLIRVDGAVFAGADALPQLLRVVFWGWTVRWVFALPGARAVARRAYRWVARRRHRLGCSSAVCRR